MIDSNYSLRDYFADHPEIKVDWDYLNLVCGPPRFKVAPLAVSVENPVKSKGKPDWKATAEHLQDQLSDVAANAAVAINSFSAQIPLLQSAVGVEKARTTFYQEQLRLASKRLDNINAAIELQNKLRGT